MDSILFNIFGFYDCTFFFTDFFFWLKGKGGKNRRRGKNEGEVKRELVIKEEGQEYAQVIRMLGNGRLGKIKSFFRFALLTLFFF